MARTYKNPPIIEAICEFRLPPDAPWDITVPGLFYERVQKEFPRKEQRPVQELEMTQSGDEILQRLRSTERMVLFAKDEPFLIQLGQRLLAVSALRPYPTWQHFWPRIQHAWTALQAICAVAKLDRLGLRYINRVELPTPAADPRLLSRFFRFRIEMADTLAAQLNNFWAAMELSYENDRDRCRVQLYTAGHGERGLCVMLDLDYFLREQARSPFLRWKSGSNKRTRVWNPFSKVASLTI